jgi:predicted dehydrogenase
MGMETVGLGVIGLGVHARRGHIDHLAGLPVRLAAVCDLNPAAFKDFPDSEHFLNEDDLLACPAVDAVMIMTPDRFHIGTTLKALRAGKHVFVEKPIIEYTGNIPDLSDAMALASERKLVLSTCHPRRFDRPFLWLKDKLPGLIEKYGPALEFRFDFSYAEPRASTAGLHKGLLLDHFGHEIDLMHFLFGHDHFRANKLFDSEIRYHVAGIRRDGLAFTFSGTRMLRESLYPEQCFVRFARAEIWLDMQHGIATTSGREHGFRLDEECGTTDYEGRFSAVNANFIAAIRGEAKSYLTEQDLFINNISAVTLDHYGEYRYGCWPDH